MEDARKAGKCSYIGLSECSASTLRQANRVAKIDFIEIECERVEYFSGCRPLMTSPPLQTPLGRLTTKRMESLRLRKSLG